MLRARQEINVNEFARRRAEQSVPADANGSFAFVGLRERTANLDDLSEAEYADLSTSFEQRPTVKTVEDLQKALGLR